MSHLITQTLQLENKPLINFEQRTFIKPNLKKFAKTQTQAEEIQPHQQIIDNFCSKLSGRESLRLQIENRDLYINYKKKLKHHRNNSLNGSQYLSYQCRVIEQIFTRDSDRTQQQRLRRRQQNHINVARYLQNMPAKVYLHQKYNHTINQKINVLQEVKQISQKKQVYRSWYNQNNNNPVRNPNFTKMTFLLQKLTQSQRKGKVGGDKISVGENKINSGQKKRHQGLNQTTLRHVTSMDKFNRQQGARMYVPNITLQPIGLAHHYRAKHHRLLMESSDLSQFSQK